MKQTTSQFRNFYKRLPLSFMLLTALAVEAQDVMMQGWYWTYPASIGVKRWGQNFVNYIPEFADAGFTHLWLPPLSRSSSGLGSVGYDVKDYYDVGEFGLGATKFGTRRDVDKVISELKKVGIQPIADMIYNHRAGGDWEENNAVAGWIKNMNSTKINAGDQPYPSDRFRCILPLGGSTGNGPGTYYIKFRSASQAPKFYNFPYTVRMSTTKTPVFIDTLRDSWEFEPNNGGSCGDSSNGYILGTRKFATIDVGGCGVDEFRVQLDTSLFNASGDTLVITMNNTNANSLDKFSDHFVFGIYSGASNSDITSQVIYQTSTDFTRMPSGKGPMDWRNFKPNGSPTQLSGDLDAMLFFDDIDHNAATTRKVIADWQKWMFDTIGIQGIRVDAVKHFQNDFMADMMDSLYVGGYRPDMVVGESFEYNPGALKGYIDNVQSSLAPGNPLKMKLFDFALRGALKAACDQFGYDVRNLFNAGMVESVGLNGINSVTFVNNHDFRDPGQPVQYNPELVYAYILTNHKLGTPCIYFTDYYANNFMRGRIKGLMRANKKYLSGVYNPEYLSRFSTPYNQYFVKGLPSTTLIYQAYNPTLNKDVIMAINFAGDTLDVYQKINMTHVAVNDTFTDIFGVGRPITTLITPNQELHVIIPPRSFTMYVKGDLSGDLTSLGDTLSNATDIQDFSASTKGTIRVFPNPFSDNLDIELDQAKGDHLSINMFDVSGKLVFEKNTFNPVNGYMRLTPPELSGGIYILQISTREEKYYSKLIKQ